MRGPGRYREVEGVLIKNSVKLSGRDSTNLKPYARPLIVVNIFDIFEILKFQKLRSNG